MRRVRLCFGTCGVGFGGGRVFNRGDAREEEKDEDEDVDDGTVLFSLPLVARCLGGFKGTIADQLRLVFLPLCLRLSTLANPEGDGAWSGMFFDEEKWDFVLILDLIPPP